MCGIAGYVNPEGIDEPSLGRVRSISNQLMHRGPDASGEWKTAHAVLIHRRLAILDLAPTGNQPIHSRSGRWTLVLNGEIVNYLELREGIGGPWKGTGDAETLVEALDRWDLAVLPKLAGMFAFAAWDDKDKRLLLVRDRLGIKPLYYAEPPGGGLMFASTPGPLGRIVSSGLDPESLSCVLALGFPPPGKSLMRGILELPPAHFAVWNLRRNGKARFRMERYWSLPDPETSSAVSAERIDEEFSDLYPRVLRQWIRSDVPVSVLLSSGVDSTAVAAGLAEIGISMTALTAKMPGMDESADAGILADRLGLPHKIVDIRDVGLPEVLEQVVAHSDLPLIDSSQVGTWLLCQRAAEFGKVVFTGDGADEIFAGYPTHLANDLLGGPFGWIFRNMSAWVSGRIHGIPYGRGAPGWRHKLFRLFRYARYGLPEAAFRWRTLIDSSLLPSLFQEVLPDPWKSFLSPAGGWEDLPARERALVLEVERLLPQGEITRLDRMSMAHGLEARPPFLDHRLVEFAMRLPCAQKLSWREKGKRPVVRWLKKQMPQWTPPEKKGFNHPVQDWFQGILGDRLLDETAGPNPLGISPAGVQRLLKLHRRKKFDYSFELWTILFLLTWMRIHKVS